MPIAHYFPAILFACWAIVAPLSCIAEEQSPNDRLLPLLQNQPRVTKVPNVAGRNGGMLYVYKDQDIASSIYGSEFCLLHIDSKSIRLKVKHIGLDNPIKEIYENSFPKDTIGVMTGGFFGVDLNGKPIPLGLEKVNFRVTNRLAKWSSGGVISSNSNGAWISPIHSFRDSAQIEFAVQSKPLLIKKGNLGISTISLDRFDRAAIGTTTTGEVVMAVISEPAGKGASLAEFSRLLSKVHLPEGQTIANALAMDGGPGAHLYVPSLRVHCGTGLPNYVPNALYLQ
ncbi:phosphodiester glycosidase family protein [Burkholderia pseudomallei]|uniref:phosphodiester glycosidase family protein n=1 Tax=Burkholderia pseudomallei TaxID=28450 RepID=UPI000F073CDB|nr:phosphodiester glycosidase family protein [Burkholderia pseudomallei]CAJ2864914.1 Predicted periplasmic protein (DUF2233) [Burkholderia pseudomallei]VCR55535.1 Predicted periplasmic protein (DUF2233) [Burkholderia pseudomallei]VCR56115.1 Predicted periplasmic protein (DUF2233) [Burkholderia pseudomallei]VCR64712.1 Predicted periplasmic protein (DUF2233) [Burkholderia pseudomallei]VCR85063.1 Predicted periplasmic protein (DUF2233) [Burkholderia pseudomallei]